MKSKMSAKQAINYLNQIFNSIHDKDYFEIKYKGDYFKRDHFFNLIKKSKNPEKDLNFFIKELVETDGLNIKGIPSEFITEELKKIAINENSYSIEYIPNPTEKDYLLSINNGFKNLEKISKITKKIMLCYSKNYTNGLYKDDWNKIPEKYKNDIDIVNNFLKNGIIEFLDKKLITKEMVIKSLSHNISYITYCPDYLKNKEVVDAYFEFAEKESLVTKDDSFSYIGFSDIPPKFLNKERILKIVKSNGYNINYIDNNLLDYEIYQEAIKSNCIGALKKIPDTFFDKKLIDLYIECGKKRGGWFSTLAKDKPHFLTLSICKEAVKETGLNLEYVPAKMQNEEICNLAINQNIKAIEYVKSPSMDLYLKAVSQDLRLRKKSPIYNQFDNDKDCIKHINNYKKTQFLLKTL